MWKEASVAPLAFMDVGQAIAQATLVAYDEGLGTCCMSSPRIEQVGKLLQLPRPQCPSAFSPWAIPRSRGRRGTDQEGALRASSSRTRMGSHSTDPAVEDELRALIQQEAPLPGAPPRWPT
jgi:hypothetical protein